MDPESESWQIPQFIKQHLLPLVLGCIGLLFLGYGLISLTGSKSEDDIIFESADSQNADTTQAGKKIMVDVSGAVVKPGVYALPATSRIQDALIAAGGLSEDADRLAVARQLNLAAIVQDASKLYVPFVGEDVLSGESTSSLINLNTASESQLDSLAGVGKVTAQKIIDNRPYQAVDELVQKKVVSQKVFDQIKEQISVY